MKSKLSKRFHDRVSEELESLQRRAYSSGILPGNDNYTRFVVVSHIRSGSTMLTNTLNAHPNIRCFFELFHLHREAIPFESAGYRSLQTNKEALSLRERDPVSFLSRYVWNRHPRSVAAVGFKLLYTQARPSNESWWKDPPFDSWWDHCGAPPIYGPSGKGVWELLREDPSIKIIHLIRENQLAAMVSAETAKLTGSWGDGASGGFSKSDGIRVRIEPNELKLSLEGSARFRSEMEQWFDPGRVFNVSFEQLVHHEAATTFRRIFQFLGVQPTTPVLKTRRMRSESLLDALENWAEIRETILDSPYSHCIDVWTGDHKQ